MNKHNNQTKNNKVNCNASTAFALGIQHIPETASSATLAFCFIKSSLELTSNRAADNFSVRVSTSVTTSSFDAALDVTSEDGAVRVAYTYTAWLKNHIHIFLFQTYNDLNNHRSQTSKEDITEFT